MMAEPAIDSSFAQTLKCFNSHFNKSMITLQQMKQYAQRLVLSFIRKTAISE